MSHSALLFLANKTQCTLRLLALLQESRTLGVPRVAIGGVSPDNAAALIAAGADCVAVISALFDSPDIELEARRFSQLFP